MPAEMLAGTVDVTGSEVFGRTQAMASDVAVRAPRTGVADAQTIAAAVRSALQVFVDVQTVCTRFDPDSALMRANADADGWHQVPEVLYNAVSEAYRAHLLTGGRFDPRVYSDLVALGYDRSLPFAGGAVTPGASDASPHRLPWVPRFDDGSLRLAEPIDLGGIGKGLAVRWAAARMAAVTADYLIEAGGDCHCGGRGPGGERWRIGVEDPLASPPAAAGPIAVVELQDLACTTSSTRLRRWVAGGRPVHHLIDPRTGRPGGDGLVAVTTVGPDAAMSEVWSKTLFLDGPEGIADEADRMELAALWVTADGRMGVSDAMAPYVIWRRDG